ncbi:hypothetical protein LSH36_47g06019 [Paralvinella palmiformis]|uniref:Uncharacterized protein n=1 Tax=Paralvinella palmiformis TaxID=53620 RepID=A0AAD9ND59_9ANNE|nr:hypothetical protein LSH36_47g06019 [Paralvinella palmiformis]
METTNQHKKDAHQGSTSTDHQANTSTMECATADMNTMESAAIDTGIMEGTTTDTGTMEGVTTDTGTSMPSTSSLPKQTRGLLSGNIGKINQRQKMDETSKPAHQNLQGQPKLKKQRKTSSLSTRNKKAALLSEETTVELWCNILAEMRLSQIWREIIQKDGSTPISKTVNPKLEANRFADHFTTQTRLLYPRT